MTSPAPRSAERRCSTRTPLPVGATVSARRVGRRTIRPGVLWDASASGALIELGVWLPLGTLLQISFPGPVDELLVAVVRTDFGREFERRYGVACLQGSIPVESLASSGGRPTDASHEPLRLLGWRWPTLRNDIRRFYRSMALKLHPDVGGSEEHFRALHRSYTEAMAAAAQ